MVIGGGPAGATASTLDCPARLSGAAVRARAVSALSHRRVADSRDLLGARAAEHAGQDEGQPLRQEVQRAVRRLQRQAVRAVLLHGAQAARVLANLAGAAQRVRQDDARQRPRARRARCTKACACWKCCFEGERAVGVRIKEEDGTRARSAGQGRRRRQRPKRDDRQPLQAARGRSGAEERRPVDLLRRGLSRHRARRRGHAGPANGRQEGLVLVHPAAQQHRQRGRRGGVRLSVQRPRRSRNDLQRRTRSLPGRQRAGLDRQARRGLLRHQGLFLSLAASRPATAGCWSATPLVFSIRSIRRACCWRSSRANWRPTPIVEGLAKGDTSAAQLGKWAADFSQGHGPHAAAGLRVLQRLQLRPLRQAVSASQGRI